VTGNPNLSGEDAKLLHKISLLMTAFRNVNPTMSIQVVHTLTLVALHEGLSLVELGRISGFKMATISRNILDLGLRNRKREPGYGLVESVVDPMELRKKQITLTPKGRELVRHILDIMKV
jgi:DNA-binding MarR family transcriptional regulator